VTQTS
jgi:hypothetical protein